MRRQVVDERPTSLPILWLVAAPFALTFLYQFPDLARNLFGRGTASDFEVYMGAGEALLTGAREVYVHHPGDPMWFTYPPPAAGLFAAFALLPRPVAYGLWIVLCYAATVLAVRLALRLQAQTAGLRVDRREAALAMLIAVAAAPTYLNAHWGQVNCLLLLACLAFLWLLERDRPWAAGCCLAAVTWIKIYPVVLLPLALVRPRGWRFLVSFAVAMVAIPLVLLPVVPASLYAAYHEVVWPTLTGFVETHLFNQGVPAVLSRLLGHGDGFTGWSYQTMPAEVDRLAKLWLLAAVAAPLVAAARPAGRGSPLPGLALLGLIPTTLTTSWSYTFVLVLPAMLAALLLARELRAAGQLAVALCALAFVVPGDHYVSALAALPDGLEHLLYSRYALACIVFAVILLTHRTAPTPAADGPSLAEPAGAGGAGDYPQHRATAAVYGHQEASGGWD